MSKAGKRNFLSWLFFKDPISERPVIEENINDMTEFATQYSTQFSNNWLKLSILYDDKEQSHKMAVFPFTIGRERTAAGLTIADKKVSRRHAVIDFQNGVFTVTDVNSSNGVEVNGRKIIPGVTSALRRNDILKLGQTEIVIIDFKNNIDTGNLTEWDRTEFAEQDFTEF